MWKLLLLSSSLIALEVHFVKRGRDTLRLGVENIAMLVVKLAVVVGMSESLLLVEAGMRIPLSGLTVWELVLNEIRKGALTIISIGGGVA